MDSKFNPEPAKMSGYLEKKGRNKMLSCYKKYWFVLEGKLLLYYRSKEEYEAISPCKGSLNLGPTCHIKPCCLRVGVFQIVSRTTTVTLRAETREEQHKWMQAFMTALNPHPAPTRMSHFRYSLGELSPEPQRPLERQNTMPPRPKSGGFIEKLQRIRAHTNGGLFGQNTSKSTLQEDQSKTDSVCEDSTHTENDRYETCCQKISISDCESIDCSFDGIYERIPPKESVTKNTGRTDKNQKSKTRPAQNPKCDQTTFCDDENCSINSNCYSDSNSCSFDANCGKIEDYISIYTEPRYEEIDFNKNSVCPKVVQTSEKIADENVKKSSCGEKSSSRKLKGISKNKLVKSKSEEPKTKLKKTESFLQRVWRKKSKSQRKCKEAIASPLTHDYLKGKAMAEPNLILPPLNVWQDVLEGQNNHQEEKERKNNMNNKTNTETKCKDLGKLNEKNETHSGPPLPPRGQKVIEESSTNDLSKNAHTLKNNETSSVISKENLDEISLDQIMEDIKKETTKQEEGPEANKRQVKVKDLIKRFSVDMEEPVELRQQKCSKNRHCARDSSELHRLLDELSKVTTAPIMTPGVTSSLLNPEISDEEILKLIPIRRRRTSEPDYDVPRSYHSLTNLPTKTEDCDLTATRFFGPILRPFDIHSMEKDQEPPSPRHDITSQCPSMTPDSLETDQQFQKSYHSHDYLSFNPSHYRIERHQRILSNEKEVIYDIPKNIFRKDYEKNDSIVSGNDSVFIDSLEMYP